MLSNDLLGKIIKCVLICLICQIVIGISMISYVSWPYLLAVQQEAKNIQEARKVILQKEKIKRQSEQIIGTVSYDTENCDLEYPLYINITNNSSGVVTSVSFNIKGRREKFSVWHISIFGSWDDNIILSGWNRSSCYRLPEYSDEFKDHLPEDLIWKITDINPKFDPEFQDIKDFSK